MYLYETHVHSSMGSLCGKSLPSELVRAYKKAGYTGFIITDHFIKGNTSVPKDVDWATRMHMYYDAYLEAKEESDKLDFDVFFGIEHKYVKGKEILIYGIDLDFLLAHLELNEADIETYAKLVHEVGGIMVHAHSNRVRDYIDPSIPNNFDVCDGIEVYNAADPDEINELNLKDAKSLGKIMISGGDVHHAEIDKKIGMAGMAFERRLEDIHDFVNALKNNEGYLIVHGEVRNQ